MLVSSPSCFYIVCYRSVCTFLL